MPAVLRTLTPNWFASVMGTGIVANAAVLLPVDVPGHRAFALVVWIAAAVWLAVLLVATAAQWRTDPDLARSHADDAAMAPFYGAPAMALMTVGAGALLVGQDLIGVDAAVVVDAVLWTAGTLLGLFVAGWVPYLMFTRHDLKLEHAFGGWLMPVVPPMVSAATGAALVQHLPAGQPQQSLLYACYAMFGLALAASVVVIGIVWARLALHGPGPAKTIPTLCIVLGPLGQSITAANLLGAAAVPVLPARLSGTLSDFGILYGVAVLGFALLWMAITVAVVARTVREGLPFSLGWWSFTFPVGTCVTGASELSVHTGLNAFTVIAAALFLTLLGAWGTAAVNTARHALTGRLTLPRPAHLAPRTPVSA